MAFGGGTYTKYDKFMPGTYINTITIGAPTNEVERGITAGGLVMDWGPDNTPIEIQASDFQERAAEITGYSADDDKNLPLREAFRHANSFIAYKLNSEGSEQAANDSVGKAKYTGKAGNNITVTCYRNVNSENKFDVSTYFNGEVKDIQSVEEEVIQEVVLTKGTEKAGTAVETATASFNFDKNKITVNFSNVPEGYKASVRVKGQVGILGFIPGRMEDEVSSDGNQHVISYFPGAPINGEMTVEAVLTKDKITVINSCTYTCVQQDSSQSGAPAKALKDNDYVVFKKDTIIPEGAGYVFEGGKSGSSVKAGAYSNLLSALEGRNFDVLVYDGKDSTVKELFTAYTKRLRDERGIYFQTVLHDYAEADHEGVISVYNQIDTSDAPSTAQSSSLVWWVGGYSSAVELNNELTSKPYDGELKIDTSIPDVQLEFLTKQGNFLFHQVSETEVYTLFDVNTFTSYTEDKDKQLNENKVIRIIDYLHNTESYQLNRTDIGRTPNTAEGRALIWNECATILRELQDMGAITDFVPENLTVDPIASDKHAVKIDQSFSVVGTIYRIYITTYVVE